VRRISKRTRAAIDRLARGAHAFHRFAHHPLCGEYAGEVVRIGRRVRLCRGCLCAASGAIAGGVGGAIGSAFSVLPLPVAAGLLVAAVPLSSSGFGKHVSRFLPAASATAAIVSGVASASLLGAILAVAAAACVVLFVAAYRRRGPDRSPCKTCPERDGPVPCRGYAAIVRRERAFRRAASTRFQL